MVPERGDVYWLTLTPQAGHEQSGRRPVFILSPQLYNERTGLAIICPITSQSKDYPYEVAIPDELPVQGVILSDHVKNLDWQARDAQFICQLPPSVLGEVLLKLNTLLAIPSEE